MSTFLHGISLANYRGIGPIQKIGPFKGCNFFIGTNNSGKSCALNFIAAHIDAIRFSRDRPTRINLKPLEVHVGSTANQVEFGAAIHTSSLLKDASAHIRNTQGNAALLINDLKNIINYISEDGLIWAVADINKLNQPRFLKYSTKELRGIVNDSSWRSLWENLTGNSGGSIENHWMPEVCNLLLRSFSIDYPQSKIIPAKRQIGLTGGSFNDFSGAGLIDKLAELQNPGPTERILRKNFDKINHFLQDVIGDPSAEIEIPHDRKEVLVHKAERVLPLSSLGTGVHEVVMIAAFCTMTENSLVCIEEPEIHLHPLLQKKLIKYIVSNTSNQYFESVIDHPNAAVFHVTHAQGYSEIELVSSPTQRFRVCHDLGYRASDILQTNSVIWVEGPSDRIYINHWINSIDKEITEGIHYSIMFYGGRLLSHLSANDEEISEFISLRKLNRNMAIIIDSDRNTARGLINDTKRRIIREFDNTSDVTWLTAGREIENYIPPSILGPVLENIYPSFHRVESEDRFSHRLHFIRNKSLAIQKDVDKIKVARAVCDYEADLSMFDLEKQVKKLVAMIRTANW
jgi:AAA15 family ATPase/GTPase